MSELLYWEPAEYALEGALAWAQWTWKFSSQLSSSVTGARGFLWSLEDKGRGAEISLKGSLPLQYSTFAQFD